MKQIGGFVTPIITIIAATSAFWYFILYDNVQIEYETTVKTLEVKNEALKDDRDKLQNENKKLMSWLKETPNSIPYLEEEINKKDSIISGLESIIKNGPRVSDTGQTAITKPTKYNYSKSLKEGETFIDPLTYTTISVFEIKPTYRASAKVSLPNEGVAKLIEIRPGYSRNIDFEGRKFKVVVQKIDPLYEEFTVEVVEQ